MRSRLTTRLRRLEARCPPVADPLYTPPEPPPGWYAGFLRVVREMGDFGADVLVTLGWPKEEVQQLLALAESDVENLITASEETSPDTLETSSTAPASGSPGPGHRRFARSWAGCLAGLCRAPSDP
jgi:hypothetical protein